MSSSNDHRAHKYLEYFRWIGRNATGDPPPLIQQSFDEMVELMEEASASEAALVVVTLFTVCDEDAWKSFILAGPICDFVWSRSAAEVRQLVEGMERISPRTVELVRRYPYVAEVLNENPDQSA